MKLRTLCVCQGGNVRSVTLAYILKYERGIDALACGWEPNSEETKDMLYNWAEKIIVLQDSFKQYIPEKYQDKVTSIDVGEDRWGQSLHPDLLNLLRSKLDE